MKAKILGYGEIGNSIREVYQRHGQEVAWRDQLDEDGDVQCELLHVCIPYNERFVENVMAEMIVSEASLVIIHSTVKPGTTYRLNLLTRFSRTIVHSPVIGVHPNLADSLETFTKWVGIDDVVSKGATKILDHLGDVGITTRLVFGSYVTEIMKIWDTTYYGMCLAINAEVRDMIQAQGFDYQLWVEYLQEYNKGYRGMGMSNVVRPYFETLNMPIGGHCIVPNVKILSELTDSPVIELIKKHSNA